MEYSSSNKYSVWPTNDLEWPKWPLKNENVLTIKLKREGKRLVKNYKPQQNSTKQR